MSVREAWNFASTPPPPPLCGENYLCRTAQAECGALSIELKGASNV